MAENFFSVIAAGVMTPRPQPRTLGPDRKTPAVPSLQKMLIDFKGYSMEAEPLQLPASGLRIRFPVGSGPFPDWRQSPLPRFPTMQEQPG